jgi:hypothetical protein
VARSRVAIPTPPPAFLLYGERSNLLTPAIHALSTAFARGMQIDDEMASSPSYYLRVVSMPLTANRMLGLTVCAPVQQATSRGSSPHLVDILFCAMFTNFPFDK